MDIKILDTWLKDHLKTSAKPEKIAEYLSLCGPSFERLHKLGKDVVYDVEVTTNRIDSASHFGIAREASAILPRFKVNASLQPLKTNSKQPLVNKVNYLEVSVDHKLCSRFSAVLIKNVKLKDSPKWLQDRLTAMGLRAINNIVDISNYLMLDLGQPVHTFDYDKILDSKMNLRASKKAEIIKTLDGQEYELPGGDIVIEDGQGRLIDLCGIMGGDLSAVDEKTKNVLLFVQTYNPVNIRKTSMSLGKRSDAAALFEKGLDTEQVEITIRRGIDMFVELTNGKPENEILDLYPNPYQGKNISLTLDFLNDRLGVRLNKNQVTDSLKPLGFGVDWNDENIKVTVPSWRAQDIDIPEDIVEEVARIYGYHNLPSNLMTGIIPDPLPNAPFEFESKIKNILKGWGGNEVYTMSMVAKDKVSLAGDASWVVKLKNPLGDDSEYMQLSLAPSLVDAAQANAQETNPFFLFEIANVYIPVRGELPDEQMTLAGIFSDYSWQEGKGIVEGLLEQLDISFDERAEDAGGYEDHQRVEYINGKNILGSFGRLKDGYLYFEFDTQVMQSVSNVLSQFVPIPKYPPQVEDLNFSWPSKTLTGDVINLIAKSDNQIISVNLVDEYESSKTFRITYQNPNKTLTNSEVEKVRNKILEKLNKKFGVKLKVQ